MTNSATDSQALLANCSSTATVSDPTIKQWIPSSTNKRKKICAKCGHPRTVVGDDPCLDDLPGVVFACCGHGVVPGYVMFENGVTIRGTFEVEDAKFRNIEEQKRAIKLSLLGRILRLIPTEELFDIIERSRKGMAPLI
jgi:hypothetical protein